MAVRPTPSDPACSPVGGHACAAARGYVGDTGGQISVKLGGATDPGRAVLQIRDNGQGLPRGDHTPATDGGGHGLRGLRERLEAFAGMLWLEDAPGAGARLRVRVPVDPC